jgi:hypothetical protein
MRPRRVTEDSASFLLGRPWLAAFMLGSAATPAAVIIAVPAPRPIDVLFAWPLVVIDRLIGTGPNIGTAEHPIYEGTPLLLVGLLVGIVLTWLHYVILARLILWRLAAGRAEHAR